MSGATDDQTTFPESAPFPEGVAFADRKQAKPLMKMLFRPKLKTKTFKPKHAKVKKKAQWGSTPAFY